MFDPKTVDEQDSFGFDFSDLLATGETIDSAVVTIEVISGTDPDPGAMILGSAPSISGPVVSIKIKDGVEGVIYCVHCLATTSTGLKKELKGDLKVASDC